MPEFSLKFKVERERDSIAYSEESHSTKDIYNIKDHFEYDDVNKLSSVLKSFSSDNNSVILFVDTNSKVWQLVQREDISADSLSNPEYCESVVNSPWKVIREEHIPLDNFLNIDQASAYTSEVDMSKITEFNVSYLAKETNNDISEIY